MQELDAHEQSADNFAEPDADFQVDSINENLASQPVIQYVIFIH